MKHLDNYITEKLYTPEPELKTYQPKNFRELVDCVRATTSDQLSKNNDFSY